MSLQILTLTLDSITAGDYLSWVRDPEPPALDRGLRSVTVRADPLGDSVDVDLSWDDEPPAAHAAAVAAGFLLTPEVVGVQAREPALNRSAGTGRAPARAPSASRPLRESYVA